MLKVLQIVIAPHIGQDGKISVTGPERRAANLAGRWLEYGISVVIGYPKRGNLWDKFVSADLPVIDFEIGNKFNFISILKLKLLIEKYDIDLIHSQGPASLDLVVAIAGRAAGVKVLITRPVMIEDQVTYSKIRKLIYGLIDRNITLKLVDHVIAVSFAGLNHLKNTCGLESNCVSLIHNGVNLERFSQRIHNDHDGSNADKTVTIGMVAQLFPPKGWPDFIGVVEKLNTRGLHLRALIVGEGFLREELETCVIEKGLENVIEFTGFRDDVAILYNQMDFFLFTTHREGLSVAVIEGMASGLPFVATDVGGIREQVIEDKNGFVVPAHNIELLTERSLRLITNPELRQEMGLKSRDFALERFSEQRMLEQHVDCYQSLLSNIN